MDFSLLTLAALLVVLFVVAYWRGGWHLPLRGLEATGRMVSTVWLQLLLGFTLAGLVQVLVPASLVARWLGEEAGLQGILVGTVAGILTPAGPYLNIPLAASLLRSGAGIGPMAAFLAAWTLLQAQRLLIWELPLLGSRFVAAWFLAAFLLPVFMGLAVSWLMRTVLVPR